MTTIKLNEYTELEQQFLKAAVKEWNDLMFTDDINHGIPKASLGGVVGSLQKKNVITCYDGSTNEFQFNDENGEPDFDNEPELI